MVDLIGTINKNFFISNIESIEIHDKNTGELLLSFDTNELESFVNNFNKKTIYNGED